MTRRLLAVACLLAPLAFAVPANAAGVPHDPPTCMDGTHPTTGTAITAWTSYATCGVAELIDVGASRGPDFLPIQGARKLGALTWDINHNVLWVCDRGRTIGTIEWSSPRATFTPRFAAKCRMGLAYDGIDGTIWTASGRKLVEHSVTGAVVAVRELDKHAGTPTALAVGGDHLIVATNNPLQILAVPRSGGPAVHVGDVASKVLDLDCAGDGRVNEVLAGAPYHGVTTMSGIACDLGGAGDRQPTTTSLTATPTEGIAPLIVTVSAGGTDPDGLVSSIDWWWGDGSHDIGPGPLSTYHAYYPAGVFELQASAIDNLGLGATNTLTKTIIVHSGEPCEPGAPPTVSFDRTFSWQVYSITLDNPGCSDVSVNGISIRLPSGFSLQPGSTQRNLVFVPDPVASDGGQTLTYPAQAANVVLPAAHAPIAFRFFWGSTPSAGTYDSRVTVDTSAGVISTTAPITVR
jgi:hypothetical protein